MARRGQHSFLKRQKEMKRKDVAAAKMARRQGKTERTRKDGENEDEERTPDPGEETSSQAAGRGRL